MEEKFNELIELIKSSKGPDVESSESQTTVRVGNLMEGKLNEVIRTLFKDKKVYYINQTGFLLDNDGIIYHPDSNNTVSNVNHIAKPSWVQICTRCLNKDNINQITASNLFIYSLTWNTISPNSVLIRLYESSLSKKAVTFTITENVYNEFSHMAEELAINKSKFVENKILEFIEKNK